MAGRRELSETDANTPAVLPPEELDPLELGPYQILERVGEGGMGVVYRARDPRLGRDVAIKVLRGPVGDASRRERLLAEARAMARLSHPNIVTVFEADSAGDELFVVMELVAGRTLRAWLDERPRGWREIVGVHRDAGRGLAAAHAANLLHRDFKPDNVLVDESGRARVTDFGLAVELDDAGTAPLAGASGTAAYMAPEVMDGRLPDVRSDVFGFCVSLWEALTGRRPFAGKDREALRRAIAGGVSFAGGAAAPAWLLRLVARGLAEDPAARPASMALLVDELGRDPGRARRRALGGAAAAALVVGSLAAVYHLARPPACAGARAALGGAWDDAVRARVARSFLGSGQAYAGDSFVRVSGALDRFAGDWVAMHEDACRATAVRHEQSEALLDLRMACLGRRLGELRALTAVLAENADGAAVQRAIDAVRGLPGVADCADGAALTAAVPPPADPRVPALQAELDRSQALWRLGRQREALTITARVKDAAAETGYAPLRAAALFDYALDIREMGGDYAAAEAALREGLRVGAAARMDREVASAWTVLLWVMGKQRKAEDGLSLATAAEAAVERAGATPALRGLLAVALCYLDGQVRRFAAAAGECARAVELQEQAYGRDDARVAFALQTKAQVDSDAGRHEEAIAASGRAVTIRERAYGRGHPVVAASLGSYGRALYYAHRLDEAAAAWQRAIAIYAGTDSAEREGVQQLMNAIGNVDLYNNRFPEARSWFERSIALGEKLFGADSVELAGLYQNLCTTKLRLRDLAGAGAACEHACALRRAHLPADHQDIGSCEWSLANVLGEEGRLDEAEAHARASVAILEKKLGPDHAELSAPLGILAELCNRQGRHAEALVASARATSLAEKAYGGDSPLFAAYLIDQAESQLGLGQAAKALPLLERAATLWARLDDDPGTVGQGELALARALWTAAPSQRPRARRLGAQAALHLRAAGPTSAWLLARAEAWQGSH